MIYKRLDPDKPAYTITGSEVWNSCVPLVRKQSLQIENVPDYRLFQIILFFMD